MAARCLLALSAVRPMISARVRTQPLLVIGLMLQLLCAKRCSSSPPPCSVLPEPVAPCPHLLLALAPIHYWKAAVAAPRPPPPPAACLNAADPTPPTPKFWGPAAPARAPATGLVLPALLLYERSDKLGNVPSTGAWPAAGRERAHIYTPPRNARCSHSSRAQCATLQCTYLSPLASTAGVLLLRPPRPAGLPTNEVVVT